jgi:hypothetical protein
LIADRILVGLIVGGAHVGLNVGGVHVGMNVCVICNICNMYAI